MDCSLDHRPLRSDVTCPLISLPHLQTPIKIKYLFLSLSLSPSFSSPPDRRISALLLSFRCTSRSVGCFACVTKCPPFAFMFPLCLIPSSFSLQSHLRCTPKEPSLLRAFDAAQYRRRSGPSILPPSDLLYFAPPSPFPLPPPLPSLSSFGLSSVN